MLNSTEGCQKVSMLIWFKGYNYDLVSGNVNSVSYNKGKRDEFRHRYTYDGDNRILMVETSREGWNYTLDAKYFYYLHGPLARTELGDYNQKVQGLDYAYTLHGWLKSVNGASLNHERDMGKDGHYTLPNNANAKFSRDAFGFMLHYYDGDYTPVGGLSSNFVPNFAGSNILSFKNDLFNGNIPFMQTSLPDVNAYNTNGAVVNSSLGNLYQYDQLNRLVEHRVFDNFNIATNTWLNTPLNNGTDKFYENFTYDANGNILNINRNGANTGTGLSMDNFTYRYNNNVSQVIYPSSSSTGYCTYPMQSNKLYHVNDAVAASNYTDDVDDQGSFTPSQNTINTANNYGYDEIGNLVKDNAENIQEITWNVYGKIESISRTGSNNKPNLAFTYDAAGQRISKTVMPRNNGVLSTEKDWTTTYYVRDATGNVMATYSQTYTDLQSNQIKEEIKLKELHLYGSSRLGIVNANRVMATQDYYIPSYNTSNGTFVNPSVMFNTLVTTEVSPLPTIFTVYKGNKQYELSNHLGNVLATISDRRVPRDDNGDLLIDYFNADILSTSDYYAFGSTMSARVIGGYRFGYQGSEKDNEVSGVGNSYTTHFRQYDPRLGRWLSIDPKVRQRPWQSPYCAMDNSPIWKNDPYGDLAPIVIWLLKKAGEAAIGVATDIMVQVAAEKYFGNNGQGHSSWGNAWDAVDIDEWQALSSGGEALIKNKHLAAAFSAASDMTNYMMNTEDASWEGAMQRGGLAVFSAYLGGGVNSMVAKYGAKGVAGGLSRMGLEYGTIMKMLGGGVRNISKTVDGITSSRMMQGWAKGKVAVIGRNMDRVNKFAKGVGGVTWDGFDPKLSDAENLANNKKWIQGLKDEGYTIYDTGLDPKYSSKGDNSKGAYYEMETKEVFGE